MFVRDLEAHDVQKCEMAVECRFELQHRRFLAVYRRRALTVCLRTENCRKEQSVISETHRDIVYEKTDENSAYDFEPRLDVLETIGSEVRLRLHASQVESG